MKLELNHFTISYDHFTDLKGTVPCSLYSVLLDHKIIEDPFYRLNEYQSRELCEKDTEFICEFQADEQMRKEEFQVLRFYGVDTLADITLNDTKLGYTDNMFRTWEFDVKSCLRTGTNILKLHFYSPLKFAREAAAKDPLWGVTETTFNGYQHIRKAHCMYGWDWGPQLPDMGIFRPVELCTFSHEEVKDVFVRQKHHPSGEVTLSIQTTLSLDALPASRILSHRLISPSGEILLAEGKDTEILIQSPSLWWPNGYGSPSLYTLETALSCNGELLDQKVQRIGLRTLTVSTQKDKWGNEFCFEINGEKIFAMGADYIPEDNILSRISRSRTEELMKDCVRANFNCIRVWGGGYYPDESFFDLCDSYGLIVWQDFMFACAQIRMSKKMEENLRAEFVQNLIRIRNHASLGLLCGNNEMETAWLNWGIPQNERLKEDYLYLYERLLPDLCEEYAPDIFYWPSSPSSGGGFDNPADENRGDMHCWEVWHGAKEFTYFRETMFRFCSEFGFEAFPSLKTCESFSLPKDRNPFSKVMESHQKCIGGNRKMLSYMSMDYLYPKDFKQFIYTSQLSQADAVRIGVEHWRRNRGRCMGATYWQLNDCWPVASWASIDYYGRWKALHYAAKRFFAPVLLSAEEDGFSVSLNLSSELRSSFHGKVLLSVRDTQFQSVFSQEIAVQIPKLSAREILKLDLENEMKGFEDSRYLVYTLFDEKGYCLSRQTTLFTKPKHFAFENPEITAQVRQQGEKFAIALQAKSFAKAVSVDFKDIDVLLSDNFVDLTDEKELVLEIERINQNHVTAEILMEAMEINSVYDIG